MWYLALIVVFIIIIRWVEKNTYNYKTVIKHLWKQIYIEADQMASYIKQFNIADYEEPSLHGFKSQIELRGKLINSILDFVNNIKKQENYEGEEETYGYGRYSFDKILYHTKTNPDIFKKLIKE
jgi:hypothetical protein